MIRCKFFLSLVLTTLTASLSFAKESNKAEDLLRYFPEGQYVYIVHMINSESVHSDNPQVKRYLKFKKRTSSFIAQLRQRLPEIFYSTDFSVTIAKLNHYITKTERVDAPEGMKNDVFDKIRAKYPRSRGGTYNMLEGGVAEVSININVGDELCVYRIQDLQPMLKKALANGDISVTDQKIFELPVYTMRGRYNRLENKQFYLYATHFDELLTAGKMESVKKMVETGEGLITNMLLQEEYVDLADVIPDLQGEWQLSCSARGADLYTEIGGKSGTARDLLEMDLEEEERKRLETMVDSVPLFSIRYVEFSDKILSKEIKIYTKEEHARRAYSPHPPMLEMPDSVKVPESVLKMQKLVRARTSIVLDGRRIIKTVVMDEHYMNKREEAYSSMLEQMEKAKKLSKQREKEK